MRDRANTATFLISMEEKALAGIGDFNTIYGANHSYGCLGWENWQRKITRTVIRDLRATKPGLLEATADITLLDPKGWKAEKMKYVIDKEVEAVVETQHCRYFKDFGKYSYEFERQPK